MTTLLDDGSVGLWWSPGMAALDGDGRLDFTRSDLGGSVGKDIDLDTWTLFSGAIPVGPVVLTTGLGRTKLDFGESEAINEQGNVVGTFSSYDRLYNFLLGASYRGMVGAGVTLEQTDSKLAPEIEGLYSEEAEASAWGVSIGIAARPRFRFTLDERRWTLEDGRGAGRFASRAPAITVSPMAAYARLHMGGDLTYTESSGPQQQPKQSHAAWGGRLRIDAGSKGGVFDIHRLFSCELLVAAESDRSLVGRESDIDHNGFELVLGGIYSLRRGHVTDDEGGIDGDTEGWGIGVEGFFPIGFRYDEAKVPQANGVPPVTRKEFMISADMAALLDLWSH